MRRHFNFFAIVAMFWLSSIMHANPDVIFSDSSDYDGAYLKHELDHNKLKFQLSQTVLDIHLPDEFFNVSKMVDFLEHKYIFKNDELKLEFLRMLRMSIVS